MSKMSDYAEAKLANAIRYHLAINGVTNVPQARAAAIGIAADVKRIVQEEYEAEQEKNRKRS